MTETKAPASQSMFSHEIQMGRTPVFITKSNYFRVIHVDGFFGGGTPTPGNLMLTVYSHRIPFPKQTTIDAMGNEIPSERVANEGMEHEYEASLVMSLMTAKSLSQWLNGVIANTEDSLKQIKMMQLHGSQE